MNELARLRGSERYGACDDAVQAALFLKGSPAGVPPAGGRGSASDSPLGERKGTFDMEDAGRNVESAFAFTLGKSNRTPACAGERIDS